MADGATNILGLRPESLLEVPLQQQQDPAWTSKRPSKAQLPNLPTAASAAKELGLEPHWQCDTALHCTQQVLKIAWHFNINVTYIVDLLAGSVLHIGLVWIQ